MAWSRNGGYQNSRSNFGQQGEQGPAWQSWTPKTEEDQKVLTMVTEGCQYIERRIKSNPVKVVGHSWIITWKQIARGIVKASQVLPQNTGVSWFDD